MEPVGLLWWWERRAVKVNVPHPENWITKGTALKITARTAGVPFPRCPQCDFWSLYSYRKRGAFLKCSLYFGLQIPLKVHSQGTHRLMTGAIYHLCPITSDAQSLQNSLIGHMLTAYRREMRWILPEGFDYNGIWRRLEGWWDTHETAMMSCAGASWSRWRLVVSENRPLNKIETTKQSLTGVMVGGVVLLVAVWATVKLLKYSPTPSKILEQYPLRDQQYPLRDQQYPLWDHRTHPLPHTQIRAPPFPLSTHSFPLDGTTKWRWGIRNKPKREHWERVHSASRVDGNDDRAHWSTATIT